MSDQVYTPPRDCGRPITGFRASGRLRVGCRRVARRRFSWRWVVFASIPVVVAGMALVFLAEEPSLRSTGLGIFVLGSALYIAARIALILEGRR